MSEDGGEKRTEAEEIRSTQLAISAMIGRLDTLAIRAEVPLHDVLEPIENLIEHFMQLEENEAIAVIVEERLSRSCERHTLDEVMDEIGITHDDLARQLLRRQFIETNPEVKGGAAVIRGTRITTSAVLKRIEGGETIEEIVADYGYVHPDAFRVAAEYERENPSPPAPGPPRPAV